MLVSSHGWFCVHHILHLYGKLLCLVHLTMSTGVITKTILPKAYRSGVSHLQVCSISSHLLISFAWTMSWGPRFLHSRDNAFGMPTMVSGIWCGVSIPYMVSWGGAWGQGKGGEEEVIALTSSPKTSTSHNGFPGAIRILPSCHSVSLSPLETYELCMGS